MTQPTFGVPSKGEIPCCVLAWVTTVLCRLTEAPPQQLAACWFPPSLNLTEWAVTLQAHAEIKGAKELKCCTNSKAHYHIHTSNQMAPTTSTKFVCNWFHRTVQRCKKRRKQRSYLLLVWTDTHHHLLIWGPQPPHQWRSSWCQLPKRRFNLLCFKHRDDIKRETDARGVAHRTWTIVVHPCYWD